MQSQQLLEQRVEDRTRELSLTNQALAAAAVERVQAEERTLQLQNQLAHSARLNSLGELATGIAHEINQPLGAIANYSETLLVLNERETADRIAIAATTQKIRDAAQRAGQIIRRMRNFVRSRPQSRSLEQINPLIEDVVALCEPDLRSHCVRVATDDYRTTDMALTIDAIGLQQVLVNIVRNAVDAMREMPADERRLLITTAAGDDDFVTITVDDTGPGFRHTPAESTVPFMTTKADGLGLGLAISRSIVEAHGGRLSLGSSPEGGARVIVSLPLPVTAPTREPADGLCC
jgi:C4-dicarboxylate-specific signal transduction histidine kinase